MAKTLDDLMKIPGVVLALEFKETGELLAYKGSISRLASGGAGWRMAAQFCATVSMMFKTLSGAFTQMSEMKWTPSLGWTYSGGRYTVAVMGNWGVFIETKKADFNLLFKELGERV